jgi:hypothetical protein
MAKWGPKDPDAIRDYGIDWSSDIGEATIAASSWLLNGEAWPGGGELVKDQTSFTDTGTVIRLSGGEVGHTYEVTNHVVLSNGEEDDWTEKLKIKER